jgi:serine/threonine protein kinase
MSRNVPKCVAPFLTVITSFRTDPGTAVLLEWPFRYNIALGLAKGLAFLHSRGPQRLAHGDIKAINVLLDRNLEPKIADFGLSRMCQNNERKVLTRIEGKR